MWLPLLKWCMVVAFFNVWNTNISKGSSKSPTKMPHLLWGYTIYFRTAFCPQSCWCRIIFSIFRLWSSVHLWVFLDNKSFILVNVGENCWGVDLSRMNQNWHHVQGDRIGSSPASSVECWTALLCNEVLLRTLVEIPCWLWICLGPVKNELLIYTWVDSDWNKTKTLLEVEFYKNDIIYDLQMYSVNNVVEIVWYWNVSIKLIQHRR